ncbi:hypothetical protein LY76DRAFT_481937, partial [Colletotrichum caudatum]
GRPLAPVSVPGATSRYRSPLASDRPSPACRHISLTPGRNTPPSFSFLKCKWDLQDDGWLRILTRVEFFATC